MKTSLFKFFSVFIILSIAISCSDDDGTLPDENTGVDGTIAITEEILKLVNEHRATKDLPPLTSNQTANELAADHTRYMIAQGKISHDNFDTKLKTLQEKENAFFIAENVASGQRSAQSVVTSWLESTTGHRENIEGNYTHIGIAATKDENGKYYYTQLFYR